MGSRQVAFKSKQSCLTSKVLFFDEGMMMMGKAGLDLTSFEGFVNKKKASY